MQAFHFTIFGLLGGFVLGTLTGAIVGPRERKPGPIKRGFAVIRRR
ncbi:MAG: hypothetical protein QM770_21400 [Tepidisphaeraceae bacterium]